MCWSKPSPGTSTMEGCGSRRVESRGRSGFCGALRKCPSSEGRPTVLTDSVKLPADHHVQRFFRRFGSVHVRLLPAVRYTKRFPAAHFITPILPPAENRAEWRGETQIMRSDRW